MSHHSITSLRQALEETKVKTLDYFALPSGAWAKQYAPGKWNIKQLLHHLVDAETILYARIRWVISEPNPEIRGFNQDRWCQKLDYEQIPLEINKAIYTVTRPAVIYLAERFYESLWDKPFVHNETGPRTLGQEFEKIAWHNAHHLEHIRLALNNTDVY